MKGENRPKRRDKRFKKQLLKKTEFMKETEEREDAKLTLSEDSLNKFGGDCMNAQHHVKDLADAIGTP